MRTRLESTCPPGLATGLICALALLFAAPAAQAEFGLSEFEVSFTDAEGVPVTQAGSHPFAMSTSLHFISIPTGEGGEETEEAAKDILIDQAPGFAGNPTATPRCATADFVTPVPSGTGFTVPACPDAAAVGVASVTLASQVGGAEAFGATYNLRPPPGVAAKLGFWVAGVPVTIELGVGETYPFNVTGGPANISQVLEVIASELVLWGTPADPAHDPTRGHCVDPNTGESLDACEAGVSEVPFLTLPRSCDGPLITTYATDSWANPGAFITGSAAGEAMSGCGKLGFDPEFSATPSSTRAESAAGLQIALDVSDEGLANPAGVAKADIASAELAFPAGMTLNPSAAEGLGVCSLAQYQLASPTRAGCPEASKLGTIEADTPILENHTLRGSLYLAAQRDNPFGSLFAAYLLIRDPELGVLIRIPTEIETDPASGRILAIARDLPPYPLERVRISLRSGPRAPFVTPPSCGTYQTEVKLTPSSGGAPLVSNPSFEIDSGPGGGPCPAGAPFAPGFEAGSQSNAAGSYSPFVMRLTRNDGDQDLTRFDATLPPGVVARLAGVQKCSDAAIAAAKGRDGREELASPSCPAGSEIGSVLTGAGVGTALTYVPGKVYLAGPYGGDPLSVVAIVPAVAGPFDVGTVVVRQALALDPVSGQAEVDSAASDPIPHILAGIPLKVRDIRVDVDRDRFTLNPTSCAPLATMASIWGGGVNPFSAADDVAVGAASRFQAASCASLRFKPKLALRLRGGVRRGAHPALRAVATPNPGEANFRRAVVTLPRSAFLDQAHIRTICTRVQFAAGPGNGTRCPKGARYGYARAWSPLLDAPAQGPVFLRSSDNKLPDLVVALKGPASAPVDVELSSRIDSVRGGIRSTFTGIPDLPVSRFVLAMQGGRKGLIVNSRHLCFKPRRNRAIANLVGQNGRFAKSRPRVVAVTCQKRRKAKRAKRAR